MIFTTISRDYEQIVNKFTLGYKCYKNSENIEHLTNKMSIIQLNQYVVVFIICVPYFVYNKKGSHLTALTLTISLYYFQVRFSVTNLTKSKSSL